MEQNWLIMPFSLSVPQLSNNNKKMIRINNINIHIKANKTQKKIQSRQKVKKG